MKKTAKLGRSTLNVNRIGLGCMGMSEFYGSFNETESIKTLHKAIDLGVNFFDTADIYGFGHSERILGSVLSDYNRNDIVIATKFANQFDEKTKTSIGSYDPLEAILSILCPNLLS